MENVKETKTLSICPCLTPAEFEHGARALVEGLNHNDHHKSTDCSWGLMSSEARLPCVVIKRGLHHKNQKHGEAALRREMANEPDLTLDEIEQADDEELMISHPTPVAKAFVEYQIHYHRTYEVPALYFFLRNLPNRQRLPTLEQAYEYLVSDSWKTMMRGVGVMGAISMTVSAFVEVRVEMADLVKGAPCDGRTLLLRPPLQYCRCHERAWRSSQDRRC